jgi:hypothetical protein
VAKLKELKVPYKLNLGGTLRWSWRSSRSSRCPTS